MDRRTDDILKADIKLILIPPGILYVHYGSLVNSYEVTITGIGNKQEINLI